MPTWVAASKTRRNSADSARRDRSFFSAANWLEDFALGLSFMLGGFRKQRRTNLVSISDLEGVLSRSPLHCTKIQARIGSPECKRWTTAVKFSTQVIVLNTDGILSTH